MAPSENCQFGPIGAAELVELKGIGLVFDSLMLRNFPSILEGVDYLIYSRISQWTAL